MSKPSENSGAHTMGDQPSCEDWCDICCKENTHHVVCGTCKKRICCHCRTKVSGCPYCRSEYTTPTIDQEMADEHTWWDMNTPRCTIQLRRKITFAVIRARVSELWWQTRPTALFRATPIFSKIIPYTVYKRFHLWGVIICVAFTRETSTRCE